MLRFGECSPALRGLLPTVDAFRPFCECCLFNHSHLPGSLLGGRGGQERHCWRPIQPEEFDRLTRSPS